MSAFGYCRVSTEAQADEGESLAVQRRRIESRAREFDDMILDKVFVERGVSGGRALKDRPEGAKLLAAVKPGDMVFASKLDRMFRSATDALHTLDDFKARKISLFLLDMGGDVTGNGISAMVFTILSAVAQFERERLQERIVEVKRDQRDRGRYLGGKVPFGFVVKDGALVPVDREQKAIALMRRLRQAEMPLRAIADEVTEKFGIKVSHVAVAEILKREAPKPARGKRQA